MKFISILLLTSLTLSVGINAQSLDRIKTITGKWKFSDSSAVAAADASIKAGVAVDATLGSTPAEVRASLIDVYKKTTFEFGPDGTYKHLTDGRAPLEGTWKLSEDKALCISVTQRGEVKRKIISLSKNQFSFRREGSTANTSLIRAN